MFRIRFIDPVTNVVISDARPVSGSVKYTLSQSSDWSASIPKNSPALKNVVKGVDVELYYRDKFLLSGSLQSVSEKFSGQRVDVALSGRGVIDDLFDVRGYSYGYYENVPRLSILAQLLYRADWRVGDITTWVDYEVPCTVDLRNEKRLLSQVSTLLSGFPSTYFRYGGKRGGKHTLDVGGLNLRSDVVLVQAVDMPDLTDLMPYTGLIESINVSTQLTEIINSVEVWGGEVQDNLGVSRTISLRDAVIGYPSLTSDPDFPIVPDVPNAVYRIWNKDIPVTTGSQSTERYTQYAPEKTNANATLSSISTAALALYERGVAFLEDHKANVDKVSVKARGEDIFVNVGDRVYITANARQSIVDPFSDQIVEVVETRIQNLYRCISMSMNFANNAIDWSYELTNGSLVSQEDIFVSIYDEAKNKGQVTGTAAIPGYNLPHWSYYYETLAGGYPDTTLSDGTPAKLFTIPVPVTGLPVWTPTKMYSSSLPIGVSGATPIEIEVVQEFAYPSTPLIVKIAVRNSGWTDATSITFNYYVVWSQ